MDGMEVAGLLIVMMILSGFTVWMGVWIARVAARQRIAENVLRERLARAWGRVQPDGPADPEAK